MTENASGSARARTDFDSVGGEAGLLAILSDFLQRVRRDVMIGFHFQGVDFARLLTLEFEFARQHLGGTGPLRRAPPARRSRTSPHSGRALRPPLAPTRTKRWKNHHVPESVIERWLSHSRELRAEITGDEAAACND